MVQYPVRLWLVKKILNTVTPQLSKLLKSKPARSQAGKIIEDSFNRVIHLHQLQRQVMPGKLDENLMNFLVAFKQALIYIMESDDVYYHWAGLFIRVLQDELTKQKLGDCGNMLFLAEGFAIENPKLERLMKKSVELS